MVNLVTAISIPPPGQDSREIILTKGYKAIVDARDYNWLTGIGRWHAQISPPVYALSIKGTYPNRVISRMHRLVYEKHIGPIPDRHYVDHINHDSLDNRLCNLRAVTNQQNQFNQRLHGRNKSGYRGVCWHKGHRRWRACIRVNGVHYHIGNFETKEEAALAYNRRALELQGEFAVLNVIPGFDQLSQPISDTCYCRNCGSRSKAKKEVVQQVKDETCVYVCTDCFATAEETPF